MDCPLLEIRETASLGNCRMSRQREYRLRGSEWPVALTMESSAGKPPAHSTGGRQNPVLPFGSVCIVRRVLEGASPVNRGP